MKVEKKTYTDKWAAPIAAVVFFCLITVSFFIWIRGQVFDHFHEDLNKQLLSLAQTIPLILPEDYHMRAKTVDAISASEYEAIENKLTELADRSGAKYLWTDVLIDGKIYLTSCNRTPGPDKPEAEIYYFMPYPDGVSAEEMLAFTSDKPVYATFKDIWGHFQAVFVPIKNPDGSVYLACAEYTVDYVDMVLEKSNKLFVFGLCLFLLAISPLCYLYVSRSHNSKKLLTSQNFELEQSKERLRTTLHSIADGVIVTDSKGLIQAMNPVAEQLCGYNNTEAAGHPYGSIFPLTVIGSEAKAPDSIEQVLSAHQKYSSDKDLILIRRDGSKIEINESAAPIKDEQTNQITGVVLIIRDVTEQNKLEEAHRQNQKLHALGQLTGGIAHDVNNMLCGISGAADLLEKLVADNDKAINCISLIKNATSRTSDLTGKLLAFGRKGKVISRPVDLHELINDTISLVQRSIDKRINISTNYTAERYTVIGDPSQIQNGLLNLCLNARDAMPEGGKLHIETENASFDDNYCKFDSDFNTGDYIRITVQDTGVGIPREIKDQIFDPFYTTKEIGQGTGLGLASVYGMISEHQGVIRFYSETGKGTAFHLYLPLPDKLLPVENKETHVKPLSGGTILLVDDEEILQQIGSMVLEHMGFNVIIAADGSEAVAIYEQQYQEIDCIILDVVMPVMNGKEAFEQLIKINPDAKIIIASGFTRDINMNTMLETGAAGYLMKPFNKAQLHKLLSEVLG